MPRRKIRNRWAWVRDLWRDWQKISPEERQEFVELATTLNGSLKQMQTDIAAEEAEWNRLRAEGHDDGDTGGTE